MLRGALYQTLIATGLARVDEMLEAERAAVLSVVSRWSRCCTRRWPRNDIKHVRRAHARLMNSSIAACLIVKTRTLVRGTSISKMTRYTLRFAPNRKCRNRRSALLLCAAMG